MAFGDPFRFSADRNGAGTLLCIRKNIPSKPLSIENKTETFFIETKLHEKNDN